LGARGNWFFGLLWIVLLGAFAYHWSGESEETKQKRAQQAEKARVAAELFKAKRERQCAQVMEALEIVAARGRAGLAAADKNIPACRRIEVEDCGYTVELLYELTQAGRTTLAQEIARFGEDCSRQLEFATKHGLAAFRDHHKLLTDALEEAREEHERHTADDYGPPPDTDYGARGRR
jgi:hypothetical protein